MLFRPKTAWKDMGDQCHFYQYC